MGAVLSIINIEFESIIAGNSLKNISGGGDD